MRLTSLSGEANLFRAFFESGRAVLIEFADALRTGNAFLVFR